MLIRIRHKRFLFISLTIVGLALGVGLPRAMADSPARFQQPRRVQVNQGAYDSLVVGVPFEDIGQVKDAGGVNVIPGSATGLTAQGSQGWNQDSPDVLDVAESQDNFGYALASGDFDGDGWPDLAVDARGEAISGEDAAGLVQVFYGDGAGGLTAAGNEGWYQGFNLPGSPEAYDHFGDALAAGDFNGDGYDDLAIGVSGEDNQRGGVQVVYGSPYGLAAAGNQWWNQDSSGVIGGAESGDWFGGALTVGDFNGDGYADLAVGIPYEDVTIGSDTSMDAGAVQVLYGSSRGLTSAENQLWYVGMTDIPGPPEDGAEFGYALAAGDFNGDGYDDLAIGAPDEDVGAEPQSGAVRVLNGSSSGLTATGIQIWHELSFSSNRHFRNFGRTLAAGDFNGDAFVDLAIGAPSTMLGEANFAGGVQVIYGTPMGLTGDQSQWWDQDSPNIPGAPEENDFFGDALTAGDFDGDGFADLAIGVPGEDLGQVEDAGGVQVLYGSSDRLTATGNQWWDQGSNIEGQVEAGDGFGQALVALAKAASTACPNDPYEPNDSLANPYDASPDFQQFGGLQIMDDAYICPSGDQDYYAFPVADGETIHIALSSLPADYDLELFDPNDDLVATSYNIGLQDESITYTALGSGWFTIRVWGWAEDAWSATDGYSMQAYLTDANTPTPNPTATPGATPTLIPSTPTPTPTPVPSTPTPGPTPTPGSCLDPYEPNDDFDSATPLLPEADISILAYICDEQDSDWFKFPVTAGDTFNIDLTNNSLNADYDLWLTDPQGNLVTSSTNSDQADEHIRFTAATGGDYRVSVTSYYGYDTEYPYLLRIRLERASSRSVIYLPVLLAR